MYPNGIKLNAIYYLRLGVTTSLLHMPILTGPGPHSVW